MPVEYDYDTNYGDRTKMRAYRGGTGWDGANWPGSPGTADEITWTYDTPTGLLAAKIYPAADPNSSDPALNQPKTVSQTYNIRNQTATRTLARGVTTTYGYDDATGELRNQTYSDSTPAVSYTYGRSGQIESIGDYTGTRDFLYDPQKPWRFTAEAHSTFYGNRVLTRLYEESGVVGRVRGFQLGGNAGSASDLEQTYGFTTIGRFETVATKRDGQSTARTFKYAYRSDSALIEGLSVDNGSHPFTITRGYEDKRDLLTSIEAKWNTSVQAGYTYAYDERAQRTKIVQSGAAFADYGDVTSQRFTYNGRGEVTGALGHLGSDPTQSGQQFPGRQYKYDYDPAGNRLWSNHTGNSTLKEEYTTNKLNQYVTKENNTVPVSGTANTDTGGAGGTAVAVQIPGVAPSAAAARKGKYWSDELVVPNTINPWRGPVTIFAAKRGSGGSADTYKIDVRMAEAAKALQSFSYDADGNLTSDGLIDYQWDAENRLVRMATTSVAVSAGFANRVIEFRYDYMHRRVSKRVLDADQNPAVEISSKRFLWDGWNLVAEYLVVSGPSSLVLQRSYTWGLDIASSLTSAGGVGALLQIADHPTGKTYLPTYDGNGNVTSLLNGATGALAAAYEYSPFGEFLRCESPDACVADQPFRFSTKFYDGETGLYYYGRRYMSPSQGRFLGRDPMEEKGGLNLYGFCRNNSINLWDLLGLLVITELLSEAERGGNQPGGVTNFDRPPPPGGWSSAPPVSAVNVWNRQIDSTFGPSWEGAIISANLSGNLQFLAAAFKGLGQALEKQKEGGAGVPAAKNKENQGLLISDQALDVIAGFEDFRDKIYRDPAGIQTIGFGHKITGSDVRKYADGITREQALELLRGDAAAAAAAVLRNVTVKLNQAQFDGLVSFVFNVGSGNFANSTLLKKLNAGDYDAVDDEMARWKYITQNGQKVVAPGLVNRRWREGQIFNGNYNPEGGPPEE